MIRRKEEARVLLSAPDHVLSPLINQTRSNAEEDWHASRTRCHARLGRSASLSLSLPLLPPPPPPPITVGDLKNIKRAFPPVRAVGGSISLLLDSPLPMRRAILFPDRWLSSNAYTPLPTSTKRFQKRVLYFRPRTIYLSNDAECRVRSFHRDSISNVPRFCKGESESSEKNKWGGGGDDEGERGARRFLTFRIIHHDSS